MENLKAALEYREKYGFSVIPVKKNKQPYIPWTEFQKKHPTEDEIRGWFKKWPSANIGIVTGQISGIDVIDEDTQEAHEKIESILPENFLAPAARTPRGGYHRYLAHRDGSACATNLIKGVDLRAEGGYIVAPPSMGQNGNPYQWMDGLSIEDFSPPPMPDEIKSLIPSESNKTRQSATIRNITFDEPGRDESLFYLANHLVKARMPIEDVEKFLTFFAAHCSPAFPPKERDAKIKSALDRAERRERNISQEVREFVMSSWGEFLSRDVQECLGLSSRNDQKAIWWALNEITKEGIIERITRRHGCYRRIDREAEEMDFQNASTETVDISMPFDIEEKVELMEGNIVVIAGEPNVGKTAFLLNVVLMNQEKTDVHYFSSEMGASELRKRLAKFDYPLDAWNFKAYERSDNFSDVVVPGQGRINIIDFLEVYDNFYIIGGHLADIHKNLKGAIAIVAIQKNPGVDVGLGGFRGLEKPRLYLAMSPGKLKIIKAKNWAGAKNPNRLQINFRIVDGCKLISKGKWHYSEDEENN